MSLRLKQALTILIGIVLAVVMLGLGLWQMAQFQRSALDVATQRAEMEQVDLAGNIRPDGVVEDIYGRYATASGSYLPEYEVLVGNEAPLRVVTAFRLSDDRTVAVVRGSVSPGDPIPEPPAGPQDIVGVFLASDSPAEPGVEPLGDLSTVRLQQLAQEWPAGLVGGYLTLSGDDSAAQGLGTAEVVLPEGEGSATHRGYAMQWWVFAGAAIAFSIFIARGMDPARRKIHAL
ncbi:SURF1 family protein [Tessaracoccus caeni]|uniref:SURF1 family protein n=1 Tax=Tessaracoccus caeni TaxID=3031239 RepID=UPI0023DC86CC|nr:SURF1 family protein [Tessaracoccus caeni]MDF1487412.1 SURF1 family protein [Tessaracoccus caeni]